VALGAKAIEKHYTLDKRLPGPDHAFAVTPDGLKQLVQAVRQMEEALGRAEKFVQASEAELYSFARRSLQAIQPIAPGDLLQEGVNFDILRPGKQQAGLHPKFMPQVEGKRATRAIPLGDGIRQGDFA
jgi:N-acetylneuraminate synthase